MARQLSNESSLENLKREAKRWLHALRNHDVAARERLQRAVPTANDNPTLRDVQLALAREHGLDGWVALASEVERIRLLRSRNGASSSNGSDGTPSAIDEGAQQFLLAASKGDIVTVQQLLGSRRELLNVRAPLPGHIGARTALHFAVGSPNKLEMVKLLLDAGANPNIRDDGDNAFPLHFVAENRELEVARLLLDHGADTDGEGDYHELGVMGWATVFGNENFDVAREMLSRGGVHTLPSAVAMGDVAAIRDLAVRFPDRVGMKLDSANRHRSLLHLAVVKKQLVSLDALIALGIDVDATDVAGLTALDQAAMEAQTEFAQRLIDSGATIELPAAIALQSVDDIERILRVDRELLQPGKKYGQLIVQASERGSPQVIRTLLKYGADVNARALEDAAVDNTLGYTALHAAAFHGNMGVVQALLDAGANPRAREEKYCATPAGWARHGNKHDVAALILKQDVDIFDAAEFDMPDQIRRVVARDPGALRRRLGEYVTCVPSAEQPWKNPNKTPLQAARDWGNSNAETVLLEFLGNTSERHNEVVSRFLKNAAPDWRLTTGMQIGVAMHTASRLLTQHPEVARENIFTAVVCGDVEGVGELLAQDPESASRPDPDRNWPPLLFLSTSRLLQTQSTENAVAIARLLLEHGADPNVYCPGGKELIGYDEGDAHFTVLTNIIGRGEGRVPPHPRARELAALLLDRGAEPHDKQVLYNVFAGHSSRADLRDNTLWLLDLMYNTSVKLGRASDWNDPQWKMLDIGEFGPGANTVLEAAVDTNDIVLTQWALEHGASANVRSYNKHASRFSLFDRAVRNGNRTMQELLLRYGADPANNTPPSDYELFTADCLSGDRARATERMAQHPEWRSIPYALLTATLQDNGDAVRLLMELGVSPDIEMNAQHARALHMAAFRGATKAARVLLDAGANPDARETNFDSTPLGTATWSQQTGMMELLTDYSRDLFNLLIAGKVDRVREVLTEEPSMAKNAIRNGETMLMRLPDNEDDAMVLAELLLEYGADPTIRDKNGNTASQLAEQRGLMRVAALLRV